MVGDILFILALVLLNGAFAMSEIAVVSARRTRLEHLAGEGSAGARRALALLGEPTRFLSAVQVGITTIGVLSGAIGEATIARHVRAALQQVPAIASYAEPLSLALTVIAITYVSLIVGELVPKRLALTNPERIAGFVAPAMDLVARAARPIVWVLTASTDGVLRLLGVRHVDRHRVTLEEIKALLEQGTEAGVLEPGEHEMMDAVLKLDERRVAAVLTPRSEIVALDLKEPLEANWERLRRHPHDVLPLCDGGLQHVVGFVRTRRILEEMLAGRDVNLRELAEPPLYVPESMTLLALLEQIKRANLPTALVIDEFGAVEGIVSLTDVLSAIVGDLPGEVHDEPEIVRRDDGSWLLDGALGLEKVAKTLGVESLTDDEDAHLYHTLGGFAMLALGRVPRTGDVFERGRYRFEIVDMDGNRVDRVLVTEKQ